MMYTFASCPEGKLQYVCGLYHTTAVCLSIKVVPASEKLGPILDMMITDLAGFSLFYINYVKLN